MSDIIKPMPIDRDIARALLKLHVLSQASRGGSYGLGIIERFEQLGIDLSPGTVYPLLDAMAREGDLKARPTIVGGKRRLLYELTRNGREELRDARRALKTLSREIERR